MDRRTLVTGGLASLLAAGGLGRVLARSGDPTEASIDPASPSAGPSAVPASPRGPSPTVTRDPTTAPSEDPPAEPGPRPSPGATAPAPVVLPLLCRDAWGAAPAGSGLRRHELRRITIHHTAVALEVNTEAPARLRQHQRHHQDQGWPDIAYHVSVDRNGHLYELRTTGARGDTSTSYDPAGHLLVLAEGNFDQQAPSDAQLEGLARLAAWGHTRFGLPLESLSGHRDHAATACPGEELHARIGDLRARAAELVRAGGVELSSRCGADGRATVAAIERGEA